MPWTGGWNTKNNRPPQTRYGDCAFISTCGPVQTIWNCFRRKIVLLWGSTAMSERKRFLWNLNLSSINAGVDCTFHFSISLQVAGGCLDTLSVSCSLSVPVFGSCTENGAYLWRTQCTDGKPWSTLAFVFLPEMGCLPAVHFLCQANQSCTRDRDAYNVLHCMIWRLRPGGLPNMLHYLIDCSKSDLYYVTWFHEQYWLPGACCC